MQNLFAKLIGVGIIAGGFALTGDLGWLTRRGMRVLDAADITPQEAPAEAWAVGAAEPSMAAAPAASPIPPSPVAAADPPTAAAVLPRAIKPPTGGPERVAISSLAAGGRLVVWLAGGSHRCIVLDIVDPTAGEALAYDAAEVSPAGHPLTVVGPPRRVVVGRAGDRGLMLGGMLHLAPTGIAASGVDGHWLGPVTAMVIVDE